MTELFQSRHKAVYCSREACSEDEDVVVVTKRTWRYKGRRYQWHSTMLCPTQLWRLPELI
jgi:hypothetical protein